MLPKVWDENLTNRKEGHISVRVLGNLHPKLRSTLRCIQLIAAVTYPNLTQYGFKNVLQPFIEDANKLSDVSLDN